MIPDLRWCSVTSPYLYKMCCCCCLKAAVTCYTIGAGGGGRTHTMSPSRVFETLMYSNSITPTKDRNIALACCGTLQLVDRNTITTCSNHSVYGHEVYINPITNADISQSDAAI